MSPNTLQNYPLPQLNQTIDEISQVLKVCTDSNSFDEFTKELELNMEYLSQKHDGFLHQFKDKENWATYLFFHQLLSLREPIPTSTSIPNLLKPSKNHNDQIYYASCLLWSIAKLKLDNSLLKNCVETTKFKGSILEETQQSNIFSSCRIPGDIKDTIYVNTESRYVVVLFKGSAFIVDIISENDEILKFEEIYGQIKAIQSYQGEQELSICQFTSLKRDEWSKIRQNISLNNKASLDLMENSILTIAIEDENCPVDYCEAINHVQFGNETGNMRYYDKIINIIVYKNCVAGLLFEHTVVDGLLMYLFGKTLYIMAENHKMEISNVPLPIDKKPIPFKFDNLNIEQMHFMSTITYFDFYSYQDMLNLLKEERVYDIWINFSLQLAIKKTFGHLNFLCITPTHVRHFKHGRSDPTYTITEKSLKLVKNLILNDSNDKIMYSFVEAVKEHRRKIKSTKSGNAVGPHIGQLRSWLANKQDANKLKLFLEKFACPAVYLTGYETVEEIDVAVSNAYARDQMTVTYLGKSDKIRIFMNTRGIFKDKLNDLMKNFKMAMNVLQNVVCKFAIASQMNALEALNSIQHSNNTNTMQQPFSIVLHAGAGAKMSLQDEIKDIVEFSLNAALSVGIHSLNNGETALDAVEKVVTSLENCFLFNAGKGSIYNEEQKHELEASIVDGTNRMSGAVACLQTVKNPIKAARIVMEKTSHSFITGCKAEELAKEHGLSMVNNSFFDTEFRRKEFNFDNSNTKNHTQTVGALALDIYGNLAAASSTGGTMKKSKGRISDTAIVGAGIYADEKVAIACSGNGEVFIRNSIASKIACHYNMKKTDLAKSCSEVLDKDLVSSFGGVIGLSSDGTVVVDSRADAMFIASYDGHRSNVEIVGNVNSTALKPPKSWQTPSSHAEIVLTDSWYHMIFDIQNTLYHSTVQFFHDILGFYYVITPITSQTISSPMGLGSDSEPVRVKIAGEDIYMADSMQFSLEYFLRLKNNLVGTYYISPSFRNESPDSTHLNQFYHVECELLGDMDAAINVAEKYIIHLTREFLTKHSSMIIRAAGSVSHLENLLKNFDKNQKFPRITLDDAVTMMEGRDGCYEDVVEGKAEYGRKLTRKGEQYLIKHFGGVVWLTDMNHLGVPFYQAYANNEKTKAKATDLLIGLGETLGLGERHETAKQVEEALAHHQVDEKTYDWYINMRRVKPLLTSGWGMGTERFLCWLFQHDDVRDMHVIPRMNQMTFLP